MTNPKRLEDAMESSALSNAESWLSVIAVAKIAAAFLVTIGVAIEFGSEWASRPFEKTVTLARQEADAKRQAEIETARREAAQARLEQERLKAFVTWRTMLPQQQNAFAISLRQPKHLVALMYMRGDPETLWFAYKIRDALISGGWEYGTEGFSFEKTLIFGIQLVGPENDAKKQIAAALYAAQINFDSVAHFPTGPYESNGDVPDAETTILIGSRFPPL